jgi:hypothetical protein
MTTLEECRADNARYVRWFEDTHRPMLLARLAGLLGKYRVVLTGSRSTGLAYPESDMEYAVVVPDDMPLEERMKLAKSISEFYMIWVLEQKMPAGTEIKCFSTKAGLPLVIISNFKSAEIPLTKLEMTIRMECQQKKITDNDEVFLSSHTEQELFEYIQAMRAAYLSGDQKKYMELKEWQRVL